MDASAAYTYYCPNADGDLIAAHGYISPAGHVYHYTHTLADPDPGANYPSAARGGAHLVRRPQRQRR